MFYTIPLELNFYEKSKAFFISLLYSEILLPTSPPQCVLSILFSFHQGLTFSDNLNAHDKITKIFSEVPNT
jgi:hypothetical protein